MAIQWFPGHMTKALRDMEKELKNIDLIFYCLDARCPISCLNPKLTKLCQNKKIIYVLNKSDLVDEKELEKFKLKLKSQNSLAITICSTESNSSKILYDKAKLLLKDKILNKENKGQKFLVNAMVVGVPNVGKSTLINNFCKKSKAMTGNKPGITKGKQWIVAEEDLTLLDTPGTLWPSFESEKTANNLAYIGSIKDDVLDIADLAFSFIRDIKEIDKTLLEKRYNILIKDDEEILQIFDDICLSRKCLLKQGELDYERCARVIIDDFRKGKLGKIILD